MDLGRGLCWQGWSGSLSGSMPYFESAVAAMMAISTVIVLVFLPNQTPRTEHEKSVSRAAEVPFRTAMHEPAGSGVDAVFGTHIAVVRGDLELPGAPAGG